MEQSKSDQSSKEKDLQNAISEYKKTERALDSCLWCLSNKRIQKHLIISTRLKVSFVLCILYFHLVSWCNKILHVGLGRGWKRKQCQNDSQWP